jgi:phosphoribosylglycinamide formyltransferase 2
MQVAHGFEVINMLDGEALDRIVAKHKPILLFLRLKLFVLNVLRLRKQGITVVPSWRKRQISRCRKAIRDLAQRTGIKTAVYRYAN